MDRLNTAGKVRFRKKYIVRSKGRFITFIVIVAFMIIGGIGFATGSNQSTATTVDEYITYTVGYGDTLWSIADEYRGKRTDVRKAIFVISNINGIQAEDLQPGMELTIPADL